MVATNHDRSGDGPRGDQLVEAQARPVPLGVPEPADARWEPLERHPLAGLLNPAREPLVLWEELQYGLVGGSNISGVSGEGGPSERPLAFAEQRSDVGWDKAGVGKCLLKAAQLRLAAQIVAVVEDVRTHFHKADHRYAVTPHRDAGLPHIPLRIALPQFGGLIQRVPSGDVAAERVVGRGLVGDRVRLEAPLQEGREHLRRVAGHPDGDSLSVALRLLGALHGCAEVVYPLIEVAGLYATVDAVRVNLNAEGHALVHGDGEGLGAAHPSQPGGEADASLQRPAEALFGHGGKGLVGTLEDALSTDI